MAKTSGDAGRRRRRKKELPKAGGPVLPSSEWEGWSTSVWDVRKPGEEPAKEKEKPKRPRVSKPKVNAAGGTVVEGSMGYGRSTRDEMRALQRRIRAAAQNLGYRDDDKIPGLGLSIRQLRSNANSRLASEGTMRSVLSSLERRQARR